MSAQKSKAKKLAQKKRAALNEAGREHIRDLMRQLGDSGRSGHRSALHKLAELLVDDSLVASFIAEDREFIYHRALEELDNSYQQLGPYQYWALISILGQAEIWRRSAKILRRALGDRREKAIEMIRKSVRVPGRMAERAADILARHPKLMDEQDMLAVGLRALQSGRQGRSRKLLERSVKKGQAAAVQAVRTLLWRHKTFSDPDHDEARLQAALVLILRDDLLDAEDLVPVRSAARHAGGDYLRKLYEALLLCLQRKPPLSGALEAWVGLLNDAELGEDPQRADVIREFAKTPILQRFHATTEDLAARRSLAPLALLWGTEHRVREDALRLMQRPALDGDRFAIHATAALFARPQIKLSLNLGDQVLTLLQGVAVSGHAVEVMSALLSELEREQAEVDPRIFDALALCGPSLPGESVLRIILVESLREQAQSGRVFHQDARRALNQVLVQPALAEEKTGVGDPRERAQNSQVGRVVKLRSGLADK